MYKTLLLPYVNSDSEAAASSVATALLQHGSTHLAVLVPVDIPMPVPHEWVAMPVDLTLRMREQAYERARAVEAKMKQRFGASAEVRLVESLLMRPSATATMHARYADLCILPSVPAGASDSGLAHEYFEDVLIGSGAPVLVVPAKSTASLPAKHVVIAWRPSKEASRAVHDALPMLRAAESIDVLIVDPELGETGHGDEPGADIAAYLARQGLKVNVLTKPKMGHSTASTILQHAAESGADLVVAGGYGHSRLREFLLGGVTLELLRTARLPVLFSH